MEKNCKSCKKKVNAPVGCEICNSYYHPSCALQAKVMNKENKMICCKPRDGSEVREDKVYETSKLVDEVKLIHIVKQLLSEALKPFEEKILRDIEDLKKSVQFMSDSFEDQKKVSENLFEEVKLYRDENRILKKRLEILEQKANNQEQIERQRNIIVSGVPIQENEDTKEVVCKVFGTMTLNIPMNKITDCFRVKQKREGPIVVKFLEESLKLQVFKKVKELKGIKVGECGLNGKNGNIFFNEDLTIANQRLFKSTRDFRKENNFAAAFCRNGKIYLRKTFKDQSIRIRSEQDLTI